MNKLTILFFATFFAFNSNMLYSQTETESDTTNVEIADTTDNDWDEFVPEDKGLNFSFMQDQFSLWKDEESSYKAPFMDVQFGFADPYYDKPLYNGNFGQIGITQIKLGTEEHDILSNTPYVFEYEANSFSLANGKSDYYNPDISDGQIDTELWTLGIGDADGYGYKISDDFKIILYTGTNMNWNHLKFDANGYEHGVDTVMLGNTPEVFGDKIRFGGNYNSGAKIQLFQRISLGAEFSQNFIFPRHMFWYWAGGEIVEAAAVGILNEFIEEIDERSPYLAPVVNILFKTGLRYGLYELKKDNMNWPINTAPPFMYESIKASVSINF
jgi:hypothetical protein